MSTPLTDLGYSLMPFPNSLGFPKRHEKFLFFNIDNVPDFKPALRQFLPAITTTTQVQVIRNEIMEFKKRIPAPAPGELLKVMGTNIGFTAHGLRKVSKSILSPRVFNLTYIQLGVLDSLDNNGSFTNGQLSHASALGDTGTNTGAGFDPNWLPAFKGEIDAVAFVSMPFVRLIDWLHDVYI